MGSIEDCIHTPASPEAEWGPLSPPPCWGIPAASETSSPLLRAGWTWAPEDVAALLGTRSGPTLRRQTALLAEEEQKKWVTVFTLCYNQKGLKHTAWLGQTSDIRLLQSQSCSRDTSPGRVKTISIITITIIDIFMRPRGSFTSWSSRRLHCRLLTDWSVYPFLAWFLCDSIYRTCN